MKTSSSKGWLIAGACLLLLGLLVLVGVLAANHWDLSALDTTRFEKKTVRIDGDFRHISLDADTEKIRFVPSEDGSCRVVFEEPEEVRCEAAVDGDTLKISRRDERNRLGRFTLFSSRTPSITVFLPQTAYGSLTVFVDTGDVEIPQDFRFDGVYVSASTGDIDCRASVSGLIKLKASTGAIRLSELSAGELELAVSTGRVELSAVDCKGEASLKVSTGKALVKDFTSRSFASEGSTGNLTLEDAVAAETISITRSTGDVTLKRCDAAELTIKTDTGDVSGSLLTPKRFIARTDTGKIDVPETDGGVCRVTTDTGDIRFTVS